MKRRELRESIYKIIFQVPFYSEDEMGSQIDIGIDEIRLEADIAYGQASELARQYAVEEGTTFTDADAEYIRKKVDDIIIKLPNIDEAISLAAKGWQVSRIGKAELGILRLGVYELLYDNDIPDSVAVNEAVELSKIYCDEKAHKFINGVLSGVIKNTGK